MESGLHAPGPPGGLRGRTSECALLDDLVSAVRGGESRSLVVRGEAGIGKTALLEYLVASASDLRVVRAVGVESDMELAFASLHQLCSPLLDHIEELPAPQHRALETVFGLSDGAAPDRFLVGLAVLSLFAAETEQRPLLCVVDDAQWLDRASALTLAFVARRLLAERVGLVFAAREPGLELQHLDGLDVRGLSNGDARALLRSTLRFKLDERILDRIIAEMRGNPLALLELPRGLTATQLAGGFGLAEAQAVTGRIQESFVRRVSAVSDDARRLLLLAAAEPIGDPLLLLRASEQLGIVVSAVDAETDGLLALGERVTFRHPLVRSAVYRTAPLEERRAAHRALAAATDSEFDPDRRAWHLAAAAAGPDERVASELERSAGRARTRGGAAAAAAFLERAVALTADPARRADRALAAAQASLQAGSFDAVLRLLATAETGPLDEVQRARVNLLRGNVAFALGAAPDAPPPLLEAARRFESLNVELARETYLTAWGAAGMAGQGDVILQVFAAVRALPPTSGAPGPLELLLEGMAQLTLEGHAAAVPTLQRAAEALLEMPVEDALRWGWAAIGASTAVWDDEGMRAISARLVRLVRDAGVLAQLPLHLASLALSTSWTGDLAGVASLIAEAESVAAATGTAFAPFTLMRLRAMQGRAAEAAALISETIEHASFGGQGIAATNAYWAAAVLNNGLARYDEAASAARQASSNTFEPWVSTFALPELIEAAIRGGEAQVAREALERLATTTRPSGTDFALGIEARCRALLSSGAEADILYREGIERLSRTPLRPELARAHLVYGEWLRRENRRVDAREQLRAAHEMLVEIGMDAFAERARKELAATGETVRRRAADTRDDLTAQERQIARLARDGLSNPEIGARLFLSPRTVEWHLHNVFNKLDIHSRRELISALPTGTADVTLV
ncbi:MAG TPA: AAA family ATPase [Solirubrobacteraceae bacterium]|nr:AAA family ATPase [Solirubrobacteraceae bacterium]